MSDSPESGAQRRRRALRRAGSPVLWRVAATAGIIVLAIAVILVTADRGTPAGSTRIEGGVTRIRVGHSPDVKPLFDELVRAHNARNPAVRVEAQSLELEVLAAASVAGQLVGISPDASLVLNDIERAWKAAAPDAPPIVGSTARYATSPVVIAVRSDAPGRAAVTGWRSLIASGLRWSHLSSQSTSSGLLALAAEFYVAAGTPRLSSADIQRAEVLNRVSAMEKSVARYGGDSEEKVVEYLLSPEGAAGLDAMTLPEAHVAALNQRAGGSSPRWQAVYPEEGTLMMDHPLVLLEHPSLTPPARVAFQDFVRFLGTEEAQRLVVRAGYRPTNYAAGLEGGPLTAPHGVNPAQPVLLPLPSPGTMLAMRDAWAAGLKRGANILLVVDVSGSMDRDNKLRQAQRALEAFVDAAAKSGNLDRVGLDRFADDYAEVVPVAPAAENHARLRQGISALRAEGNTAVLFAAWAGQRRLKEMNDPDRINAVVLMTDGVENASRRYAGTTRYGQRVPPLNDAATTAAALQAAASAGPDVLIFTVAYGGDADARAMRAVAAAGRGQYYAADTNTISRLYLLIKENF